MKSFTIQPYRLGNGDNVVVIANVNTSFTDLEAVKATAVALVKALTADGVRVVQADDIVWTSGNEDGEN